MNGPTFAPAAPPAPVAVPRPPARPPARPAPVVKPADDAAAALRVLTYLKLHWLTILFCGGLLGGGLAYAAWTLLPPKFVSYAVLQVASAPEFINGGNDPNRGATAFNTYMKTQTQLIKYQFVLESALNDSKYKIASLPTITAQKNPIKFLDEKLVVGYAEGGETIRIELEGDRPEDIQAIVDAVTDAYLRENIEREKKEKSYLMQEVRKAKADLEGLMKTKAAGRPELVANAGLSGVIPASVPAVMPGSPAPLPLGTSPTELPGQAATEPEHLKKARYPALVQSVITLEQKIEELPLVFASKSAELEARRTQIKRLETGAPPQEALAAAEKDPEVMALQYRAKRLKHEVDFIRKVVNNPNNDRIARAQRDAETAEAEWVRLRDKKAHEAEQGRRQGEAYKLFADVEKLERELAGLKEWESHARRRLEDARKAAAEMTPEQATLKPIVDPNVTEISTLDNMYRALTGRDIVLEYELKSPERVRKLQSASVPSQKDPKKQIIGTVVAGLMGFALVGIGLVALESSARRVSSLGELKSSHTTPVVGVIPWQPGIRNDPARNADTAEAIDKLRAYVSQTWLARGATTVAVTSPVGDEGKAFTAFGLAESLARAGYKTLLVDFDLRTPTLHNLAGVDNNLGVCEMLRGETEPRMAVVGLPGGLWFLSAGRWSEEAKSAAVGGRLDALLHKLKEPFDCVVLHGHALLTVAETVEVVRRSEVVLLCTQYRESRVPLLQRAADRIAAMEVTYSGLVYVGATPEEALC